MKFFCEYCGNRIDSEIDDKCPHCGASYKKNKEFLKYQEEENQLEEQAKEFRKEVTSRALDSIKFSKKIVILPIFIFIFAFTIIVIGAIKTFNGGNIIGKKIDPVKVEGLNNYGSIDKYGFSVTGYEIVQPKWPEDNKEGYECVKFYIQVKNTSNNEIDREDVNCIVDGVAQNQSTFGNNTMEFFIGKGLTVKGEIEFIVPKSATSYDIKYGDYITVHIDK